MKKADITKFKDYEVAAHIRHDLRDLPYGKYSNGAVDQTLSGNNYSLIQRGNAKEIMSYRRELEKEIFHYRRKNLVHAVEVCIQCPSDCPEEQKEQFFQESYHYVTSLLPMGERCVLAAEVHKDERHHAPDGSMISKDHIHIMYVPAVKDEKHAGYQWRLCADQLTKRKNLREFHPGLQKHLDDCGIHATVYQKRDGADRNIGLSVKQLKEITAKTGIVLDKSISVERLAEILVENEKIKIYDKKLERALDLADAKINSLKREIEIQKERIVELEHEIEMEKEVEIEW